MKELRNYQRVLLNTLFSEWDSHKTLILQLPTGGGKTIILTHVITRFLENSQHGFAVIIAHRNELVSQISLALNNAQIIHDLIVSKSNLKNIIDAHIFTHNKSYFNVNAKIIIASVDTLIRLEDDRFDDVSLVIHDEGHHVLRENKWGKAHTKFPADAKGLLLTATPCRADGKGLGIESDGIAEKIIHGSSMRTLIKDGFLSEYRILAPACDIVPALSNLPLANNGDFAGEKLRMLMRQSKIVGDVVTHYLKHARGRLGITFAASIENAEALTKAYLDAGVTAALITGETPAHERALLMRRFKNREILQLVNVDILGEGVDIPAVEVVSFARPTASFGLYCQQFGRALRIAHNKKEALIIDHVDNVRRLGLPDRPRHWSLDRKKKKKLDELNENVIPLTTCANETCLGVYERILKRCPYCLNAPSPTSRKTPAEVDGDLIELDKDALLALRKEIIRIDSPIHAPKNLSTIAAISLQKKHKARQEAQRALRRTIIEWTENQKREGITDRSVIYRKFYFLFGVDVLTAQALNTSSAISLQNLVKSML